MDPDKPVRVVGGVELFSDDIPSIEDGTPPCSKESVIEQFRDICKSQGLPFPDKLEMTEYENKYGYRGWKLSCRATGGSWASKDIPWARVCSVNHHVNLAVRAWEVVQPEEGE